MVRVLAVASLAAVLSGAAPAQTLGVLHIKVTLSDAARPSMPVPRHALLISDNPSTSAPRRVLTAADGTAEVRLRPGNYTVESDEPVMFGGRGYQWAQNVDITASGDVVLELNAANAEVGAAPATASAPADDPMLLLPRWQGSVIAVWTPTSRTSGFVVDATSGLVVTSQRLIGAAVAVDVQLTPSVKVAAQVLAADRARDVAVLWIDPAAAAAVPPLSLGCGNGARPPLVEHQKMAAIGAPLTGPKEISLGDVIRADPHASVADFRLASGSIGGPVFSAGGAILGLSSIVDGQDGRRNQDARVVAADDVCEAIRSAEKAMPAAKRPSATHLPVEPLRPFPAAALEAEVKRRAGALTPYQVSSADFDVAFLTPVMIAGAQQSTARQVDRLMDFGDWSEYFADVPPVLVVRVTPKQAESFWTTFARGAAYTQGVALPPIKHFKPGFSRMRAYCGDVEVTPLHPFILEQRVSETDAVREGLYVFAPDAFGPHCASVRLLLSSEKDPRKQETRSVDPPILERIWQDFAPYRAQ